MLCARQKGTTCGREMTLRGRELRAVCGVRCVLARAGWLRPSALTVMLAATCVDIRAGGFAADLCLDAAPEEVVTDLVGDDGHARREGSLEVSHAKVAHADMPDLAFAPAGVELGQRILERYLGL